MGSPNPDSLRSVLWRRLTRRRVLQGGWELGGALAAGSLSGCSPASAVQGFDAIWPSHDDRIVLPEGYRAEVLVRWGDPLFSNVPPLDPLGVAAGSLLRDGAGQAQLGQFGFNCDGLGLFPLQPGRFIACINNEYVNPELMFPGMRQAFRERRAAAFVSEYPETVACTQAAVGISVVELEADPGWRYRVGAPANRRITANTPMELTGPARGHELFRTPQDSTGTRANGTFGNCAAGVTPWGTYLSAEENVHEYFGNGAMVAEETVALAHRRMPLRPRQSRYRWEYVDPRFDSARFPREALKFGWVVELDPYDVSALVKKRTALGRFKHEGATPVIAPDGRLVIYMGDDEIFEYFYKFVTAEPFDPQRPERNRDLLDSGTLYVARFDDDGRGEWMPLVWGENPALTPDHGFLSQGDVVLRCREAADLLGATPLDRPEDVAVSPLTGKVYVACTMNPRREGEPTQSAGRTVDAVADAANPRAPNPWGHILELKELGDDPAGTGFRWEVFLLAGNPAEGNLLQTLGARELTPDSSYFGGSALAEDLSALAAPDNLTFDAAGNLWIVTDGTQPLGHNNGCFVCPTEGQDRGVVRQFMSAPVGSEAAGCEITPDGRTLFLAIQHPGEGGSVEEPLSSWPDGGDSAPRPSLVAITPTDPRRKLL